MTEEEYKKKIWEILKGYSDELPIEDAEELLDKIMAVELPGQNKEDK